VPFGLGEFIRPLGAVTPLAYDPTFAYFMIFLLTGNLMTIEVRHGLPGIST
jgi:hypothetical protein